MEWRTIGLLGCVCLAALIALRMLGRRDAASGAMRVLARLPVEPRRSLVLVQVGTRRFLVGVGEGPMTMLAELQPGELLETPENNHSELNVSKNNQSRLIVSGVWARAWRRVMRGGA